MLLLLCFLALCVNAYNLNFYFSITKLTIIGLVFLFKKKGWKEKIGLPEKLLSIGIGLGFLLGTVDGEPFACFSTISSLIISITQLVIYYKILTELFSGFIYLIKNKSTDKPKERNYFIYLLSLIIAWLPGMIINSPGIIYGDLATIFSQYFHLPNQVTDSVNLLNEAQYITNHHSVAYTYWMGFMIDLFPDRQISYFVTMFIQALVMAFILAYMLKFIEPRTNKKIFNISWIFLCFSFGIQQLVITGTKDILFSGFFILFLISYKKIIEGKNSYIECLLFAILSMMFRNNAFYAIIITLVLYFIIELYNKKQFNKMKHITLIAGIIIFSISYNNIFLPSLNIAPSSPREMLSIPFQQTARTVKEHGASKEDMEIINKIIDVSEYDYDLSDMVKDTYNKNATKEELMNYFKLWAKMGMKHPITYIESTLANNINYIDLEHLVLIDHSTKTMDTKEQKPREWSMTNKIGEVSNVYIYKNSRFSTLQDLYLLIHTGVLMLVPVIELIEECAIYLWACLFFLFLHGRKKNLFFIAPVIYILILFAGPIAYFRYLTPLFFALPLLLTIGTEYTEDAD